jgi:hypothetical protein
MIRSAADLEMPNNGASCRIVKYVRQSPWCKDQQPTLPYLLGRPVQNTAVVEEEQNEVEARALLSRTAEVARLPGRKVVAQAGTHGMWPRESSPHR